LEPVIRLSRSLGKQFLGYDSDDEADGSDEISDVTTYKLLNQSTAQLGMNLKTLLALAISTISKAFVHEKELVKSTSSFDFSVYRLSILCDLILGLDCYSLSSRIFDHIPFL
jgi:hypothetical protein